MNKSNFFTGQPIFCQLLGLLSKADISKIVREHKSDHYYKSFKTWNHLVTMLYGVYQNCTSLRELTTGMLACEGRLQSLGMSHFPKRSTLSEANLKRDNLVFEQIYNRTYLRLREFLPDSRSKTMVNKLIIIDSSTISLFQEIFTAAGRDPQSGKRKGGVKVHMAVHEREDVPYLIRITASSSNDSLFLKGQSFPVGSYLVFDKGYHSYDDYNRLTKDKVNWITRRREKSIVQITSNNKVSELEKSRGILNDQQIILGHQSKAITKVKCRLITFWDSVNQRTFEYITNNLKVKASTIADLYKRRWQIELLFKRLKQNLLHQYFLGDNQNAIKIQIWVTLLADLLLRAATSGIKRKWSYANLAGLIRIHLMNYTQLKLFLENPEKARITMPISIYNNQLKLYLSG